MFTKAVLGQKNKNDLLKICKSEGIDIDDSRMTNSDIVDLILLNQEDSPVDKKETNISPSQEVENALERVMKLEEMYKAKISEIDNSRNYKPKTVLSQKLSKDEIKRREAQIVVNERKGKSVGQLKRMLEKEMMSLHRVIVTEVRYKQTASDTDIQNRLVGWGNSIIGYKHSPVPFGIEYVLPLGVLRNLEAATIKNMKTEKGNNNLVVGMPEKRFKVDYLPQFTEDEIASMKEKQILNKAAGIEQ